MSDLVDRLRYRADEMDRRMGATDTQALLREAAAALGGAGGREVSYEAWRISYQSSEQAARAAYAESQRLAAALEAAREDAERYRWLRDSPERPCRVPCAYAVMPGDVEYPTPLGGEALDAAIDQARGKGANDEA